MSISVSPAFTSARNVMQKEIARSSRGIIRVSPSESGVDLGLDPKVESIISDSLGNPTPLEISQKSFTINDEFYYKDNNNNKTKIELTQPKPNDILVGGSGEKEGQYIKDNLWNIIKSELSKYDIFDSVVPIGSVFYVALSKENYKEVEKVDGIFKNSSVKDKLPKAYKNYAIAMGQEVSKTTYADLYKVLGDDYKEVNPSSGKFRLPDLRNRFVRGASKDSKTITSDTEGTYTINASEPGTHQDPQTDPYFSRSVINSTSGWFWTSVYQSSPSCGGCFSYSDHTSGAGHRKYNGGMSYVKYHLNLGETVNQTLTAPKETRPYNLTLVPIIKISGTNGPEYL